MLRPHEEMDSSRGVTRYVRRQKQVMVRYSDESEDEEEESEDDCEAPRGGLGTLFGDIRGVRRDILVTLVVAGVIGGLWMLYQWMVRSAIRQARGAGCGRGSASAAAGSDGWLWGGEGDAVAADAAAPAPVCPLPPRGAAGAQMVANPFAGKKATAPAAKGSSKKTPSAKKAAGAASARLAKRRAVVPEEEEEEEE
jgi:hypothetical protein